MVGPLSAVQPPFDINFPWSMGYIKKVVFRFPGETISLPVCVKPAYGTHEYQTLTDTALSWYLFTPWLSVASEIHFLCSENFMLGQGRIQTTDLSMCRWIQYHWNNVPWWWTHEIYLGYDPTPVSVTWIKKTVGLNIVDVTKVTMHVMEIC